MKKVIAALLAVLLVVGTMPVFAAEVPGTSVNATVAASGNCGAEGSAESVKWSLDSDGTLTVSGNGDMINCEHWNAETNTNYYAPEEIPWHSHRGDIKTVIIENGVTSIGSCAFFSCAALKSVTIPDSVTSIGGEAFGYCTSLESIQIPNSMKYIGLYTFAHCTALTSVTLPESLLWIESEAFYNCTALTRLTIPESVEFINPSAFSGCKNLTLYGASGGYVEQYAKENGIPFEGIGAIKRGTVKQGELRSVNEEQSTISVYSSSTDSVTLYSASADAMSSMKALLNDKTRTDKTIIFRVIDNTVERAASIFGVFSVEMRQMGGTQVVTYEDGKYGFETVGLRVRFTMTPTASFSEEELKASGAYALALDKLTFTCQSENVSFDETEINWRGNLITYPGNNSFDETFTLRINTEKPPTKIKEDVTISLDLSLLGEEGPPEHTELKLSLWNKDLQMQIAKERKSGRVSTSKGEKLREALQGVTLVFDTGMDEVLTPAGVQEIKELLAIYIADVISDVKIGRSDSFEDKVVDKIQAAFEKELGIEDSKWYVLSSTLVCRPIFKIQNYSIKFDINLDVWSVGENVFGGLSTLGFDYYIYNGKDLVKQGIGNYTFADINSFSDIIMDATKEWYKEVEGKKIDEIVADYLVEKIVDETMQTMAKALTNKWKLSDGIFNLMKVPVKRYIKIKCPVDVYVYDMNYLLSASIINNEVHTDVSDVFCYVDEDTKYVYLTGDDYFIKLVGNGEGTMTYSVEEYSADELLRTVTEYDLPLEQGKTYYGLVPDIPYVRKEVYSLISEDVVYPVDEDTYTPPTRDDFLAIPGTTDENETNAWDFWHGTSTGTTSNPLATPTGADDVAGAVVLLGVAAGVLGAGAARVRKRK